MIKKRIGVFTEFVQTFARLALHVREVIASLILLIALGTIGVEVMVRRQV